MHELAARLEDQFRNRYVGRRMEVLWETEESFGDDRRWSGLTGNYLRVVTETSATVDLHNQVTSANLLGAYPGALYGQTEQSHSWPPDEVGSTLYEANQA